MMKIAAVVLIVLGVIALAYGGISYTKEKKVIDLGPLQARAITGDHPAAARSRHRRDCGGHRPAGRLGAEALTAVVYS